MPDASFVGRINKSLWEATAVPPPPTSAFRGTRDTDVAIVGCGFLGAATALSLAEAGVSVTLMEAAEGPGGGASGRSGGQVIPGLRHDPALAVQEYGPAHGSRLDGVMAAGGRTLFGLVERLGIPCDAMSTGWIQGIDTEAGLAEGATRVAQWQSRGVAARMLSRDEVIAALGSTLYIGGWINPEGGSVQPLSYVRGLARSAQAAGAQFHGASPVTGMLREGGQWLLETPEGKLRARRVLLATNARDGGLWPGLQRSAVPAWSFQVATSPLSAEQQARILPARQAVSDTRRILSYFRRDASGRLVMGGSGTMSAPRSLSQFRTVRRLLTRAYPELAGYPLDFAWGGQVSVTPGRWPRLVRLGPDAWSVTACNGRGVAMTTALAPHLAEMLATGDEGATPLPASQLAQIPFYGLRRVYVGVFKLLLRTQDALERQKDRA